MQPGYYNAQWADAKPSDPFIIIWVYEPPDKNGNQWASTFGDELPHHIEEFKDIRGPLDPEHMFSPSHPE